MDSAAGGPWSRAPRLKDLLSLCRALNEGGARGTMDIDLLIAPSPDNVRKVKTALAVLADNAAAEVADDDVERYTVVRVADEIVVDLMAKAGGVAFDEVFRDAEFRQIEGVHVPFADARALIRTKDTVRPKDRHDVLFLRRKLENRSESGGSATDEP